MAFEYVENEELREKLCQIRNDLNFDTISRRVDSYRIGLCMGWNCAYLRRGLISIETFDRVSKDLESWI